MVETISFATNNVDRALRVVHWAGALSRLCGQLEVDDLGARTLDGTLEYGSIDLLKLCYIEASRHRTTLSPRLAKTAPHPIIKVVLQQQGESIYEQDGKRLVVSSGEGVAYDVSTTHQITNLSSSRHFAVLIPKDMPLLSTLEIKGITLHRFSIVDGIGRLASNFVQSIFAEMPVLTRTDEGIVADTIIKLLQLPLKQASNWHGQTAPTDIVKKKIKAYIQENLLDPDLSVDQIAVALRLSKSYLHRCFSTEPTTIAGYIWNERLERCRRNLSCDTDGTSTLTHIAFSSGFNSSSHFSRLFKKRFGITPSQFSRQRTT